MTNPIINAARQIGSAIGSYSQSQINSARDYATSEREAAQNYQTEMSNTAIQRQMADYKAAGLNPYAMFVSNSASGASTPASSGASFGGTGDAVNSAASVGLGIGKIVASVANSALSAITGVAKAL